MLKKKPSIHNIVFIGNESIGKTCLLNVYKNEIFPDEYVPNTIEQFFRVITVEDVEMNLLIHDTHDTNRRNLIKDIAFSEFEVVVLCYAVNDRASFDSIKNEWLPEMRHYHLPSNYILVATKKDVMLDGKTYGQNEMVMEWEGTMMARDIKAFEFVECSGKENVNVKEVFEAIGRLLIDIQLRKKDNTRWYHCFCCYK